MNARKIVVAVSFEEETQKPLMQLKNMDIHPDAEIHLVHVIPVILYARGMSLSVLTYPLPEDRPRIEESVLKALTDVRNEIFPKHKNVVMKCLFDVNTKAYFTEYVEKEKADLVVVATRGRHGLFDSSFAQHQLKHSSANLLVLR